MHMIDNSRLQRVQQWNMSSLPFPFLFQFSPGPLMNCEMGLPSCAVSLTPLLLLGDEPKPGHNYFVGLVLGLMSIYAVSISFCCIVKLIRLIYQHWWFWVAVTNVSCTLRMFVNELVVVHPQKHFPEWGLQVFHAECVFVFSLWAVTAFCMEIDTGFPRCLAEKSSVLQSALQRAVLAVSSNLN